MDNGRHSVLVTTKHLVESEGYGGELKRTEILFNDTGGDVYRQYLTIILLKLFPFEAYCPVCGLVLHCMALGLRGFRPMDFVQRHGKFVWQ